MAEGSTPERPTKASSRFTSSRRRSERLKTREGGRDSSTAVTFKAPDTTPPPVPVTDSAHHERTKRDLERELLHRTDYSDLGQEDYARLFKDWFVTEDYEVLTAISSPENFVNYADHIRSEVEKEHAKAGGHKLSEHDLWAEVSHEIKTNVALRFSRLYRQAHTTNSNQFMHEIENENFMRSIKTANETMARMIDVLSDNLSRENPNSAVGKKLAEMQFFKHSSMETTTTTKVDTGEKDASGNRKFREIHRSKSAPVAGTKEVSPKEFLTAVANHAKETIEVESFSHNISVLFQKGPQDPSKGFWATVAQYEEENMKSVTLDAIHHLPDSDAFIAAAQLYTKYLQNEFALQDWMHDPKMFTPDHDQKWSAIQQKVLDDLKLLFPKLAEAGDDWRLNRAMNIGLGYSRGILLTEPTTAAWADPHNKGKGPDGFIRASYASYSTNDNAALNALNGQHLPDRWRHHYVYGGALMFIPVANVPRRFMKKWDHRVLWEEMKKRNESYEKGDSAYAKPPFTGMKKRVVDYFAKKGYLNADGKVDQDKLKNGSWLSKKIVNRLNKNRYFDNTDRMVTMMEFLPNLGKVGSHVDRKGWRFEEGFDGWFVRDPHGVVNLEQTWKSLENIGFEAVRWFGEDQKLDKKGSFATNKNVYEHIYKKYIAPPEGGDFNEYFAQISKANPGNPEGAYMSRAYASILRQRMPSKLIIIDRSRHTVDGNRAWQRVLDKANFINTDLEKANNPADEMSKAMRNLMMVEQKVRQETSEKMKKFLSKQRTDNKELATLENDGSVDYRVDAKRIKEVLQKILPEGDTKQIQIDNTLQLFEKMNEVLDKEGYFLNFADRIRDNGKTFKYFPFSIAAEELDTSFATFRNAGPTVMKRAIGDLATVEVEVVQKIIKDWVPLLKKISLDGKHEMGELLDMLKTIHTKFTEIHDDKMAFEVVHHLAFATVSFFRKDEVTRGFFRKWFAVGDKHSLAAELASGNGTARGVWEWTRSDISKFRMEMDRMGLLPSDTSMLTRGETVNKKFLGIFPYKKLVYDLNTSGMDYSAQRFARDTGTTKFDMMKEYITKYLPILGATAIYMMIRKAAKEAEEKK